MINMGLTAAEAAEFYALLRRSHKVKSHVLVIDNAHNLIVDASDYLMDGTVDMDSTADITRSAKIVLADPDHRLGLDIPNASAGINFYGKNVRIYRQIWDADNPAITYTYPLITGPITDVKRNGFFMNVEVMGKEVLAKNSRYKGETFPAGAAKRDVIVSGLSFHAGETRFDFDPVPKAYLAANWSIERGEDMWARFKEMAESMGQQLFYNAWGNCVLRTKNPYPVWTFNNTYLTSKPESTFDIDDMANYVHVTGGGAGGEARYTWEGTAPAHHPFSPQSLAINGAPQYIPVFIEDDTLQSMAQAQEAGMRVLEDRLMQGVDVNFTCVTIPHLEEDDIYFISTRQYAGAAKMTKWTIPLVGDSTMSVGFLSTTTLGSRIDLMSGPHTTFFTGTMGYEGKKSQKDMIKQAIKNGKKNKNKQKQQKNKKKNRRDKKRDKGGRGNK